MPRFLLPEHSTPHRVAAIALYRALLTRCTTAPLADELRSSLRNVFRQKFRKNAKMQSARQLGLSFRAGYEALDRLDAAKTGDDKNTKFLKDFVTSLPTGLKLPPTPRAPSSRSEEQKQDQSACLPPEAAVLNVRPHLHTSGPRHVPVLSSANGVPFLRLKKPQPESLSRMLRTKLERRHNNFDEKILLSNYWLPIAKQEDDWDSILERDFETQSEQDDGERWVTHFKFALEENTRKNIARVVAGKQIAQRMQDIVDQEMALALKEGEKVIRGRRGRPSAKIITK